MQPGRNSESCDEADLEDYIVEMEVRADERAQASDDIFTQLMQKEKDLILAAQLGKALLEKNEDLSRQNEKIAEEFSQKLEVSNFVIVRHVGFSAYTLRRLSEYFGILVITE